MEIPDPNLPLDFFMKIFHSTADKLLRNSVKYQCELIGWCIIRIISHVISGILRFSPII